QVMLQVLDTLWKEHLQTMDNLRQGIHLRGYAQKNPKQEYKRESFELFQHLLGNIKKDVIKVLSHVQIQMPEEVAEQEVLRRQKLQEQQMNFEHASVSATTESGVRIESGDTQEGEDIDSAPFVRGAEKVGRNSACPCGSGKKYKQCHGKLN
ncbi:MAG: preprotein translocase subunit SecA, partial [Oceanospirillaceae bacterium]